MSLPIYQDYQTPLALFRQLLMGVTEGAFCMTRNYHSLGLTRIEFYFPKVTSLTDPAEVTAQGLCYCNSNACGWHNSYQNGVISMTYQVILQNGKKPRSVQEDQ